jgi:hypothetical protein
MADMSSTESSAPIVRQSEQGARRPDHGASGSLFAILTGRASRSAVRARRYWLTFLDASLAREIRAAGAMDVKELAAVAPRVLGCDADRIGLETIQEWWEYTWRRGWLEPTGSRCRLSPTARAELRAESERVNSPDPKRLAGGLARWVILPSLTGTAVAVTRGSLSIEIAVLVIAAVIAVGLLITGAVSAVTDPVSDRWLARRACDWLEGRPLRAPFGASIKAAAFTRLYDAHDREALGLVQPSLHPPRARTSP